MRQFRKWEVEVAPRSNAKIGGAPSAEETGYRAMNNVERRTVLGWNSLNDVPRRVERKLKVHCGVAVHSAGQAYVPASDFVFALYESPATSR